MIAVTNADGVYAWLPEKIAKAAEIAAEIGVGWRAELGVAASKKQVDACERAIGTPLSASHRDFLQVHDGAYFAIVPPDDDTDWSTGQRPIAHDVWLFSCAEIVTATNNKRAFLRSFFSGIVANPPLTSAIVVARYDWCGDVCLSTPDNAMDGEYAILDGFNEAPDEWVNAVIARSFREWLQLMFAAIVDERKLPYYWMPTRIDEIIPRAPDGN